MNSYRKKELLALGFLLFNTLLFTGIFYYDLNKAVHSDSNEDIGSITFKYNTIQRKYDSQIVWKNLFQNSVLKNKDTIRTYEGSDAMITLADGTEIQVDENSLIYLDLKPEKKNIQFSNGSIQVKTGNKNLSIQSGGKEIKINEGNFHLEKRGTDDLNFTVDKGNAKITMDGKTHDVGESQVARIGKDGLEVSKLPFQPISPENQKKIITYKKDSIVQFKWNVEDEYSDSQLEISRNRDFSNIIKKSKANGEDNISLEAGTYFWRVTGKNKNGKKEIGESRKFMVIQDQAIDLVTPGNREKINLAIKPQVYFSWTVSPINSKYKLEISTDKNFSEIKKSLVVNYNSISVNDLKKGEHFWRITNIPLSEDVEPRTSRIGSFILFESWQDLEGKIDTTKTAGAVDSIKEDEKEKTEVLQKVKQESLQPNNIKIDVQKQRSIQFRWDPIPEIREYKFSILDLQKKGKIVYQARTTKNQILLKDFSILEVGKFRWEITPISSDSKAEPAIGNFEIIYNSSLRKLNPDDIKILSPETIYRD